MPPPPPPPPLTLAIFPSLRAPGSLAFSSLPRLTHALFRPQTAGVNLLMYILTNDEDLTWSTKMGYYFDAWFGLSESSDEGFSYILEWGPNRYSANSALLAAVFAKYNCGGDCASHEHALWAASQVSNTVVIKSTRRPPPPCPLHTSRGSQHCPPPDRLHVRLQRCIQIVRHRLR